MEFILFILKMRKFSEDVTYLRAHIYLIVEQETEPERKIIEQIDILLSEPGWNDAKMS